MGMSNILGLGQAFETLVGQRIASKDRILQLHAREQVERFWPSNTYI